MSVEVGAVAPEFNLKDQNNREIRLSDYRSRANVLLVFYPHAFTGTCQDELSQIRDGGLTSDEVQVLTVSVDSPYAHKAWAEREGFDFPLLADFWPHGAVASEYGVFNEKFGFANRGTFLIDKAGVVRYVESNGPGEPRDVAEWHKAIAALP